MSETSQPLGSGPIIATGLVASAFGGAVSTLVIGYIHFRYSIDFNQPDYAIYAGSIHTVCETGISALGMLGHLLFRKILSN